MPDDLDAREDLPRRRTLGGPPGRELVPAAGQDVNSWYVPLETIAAHQDDVADNLRRFWKIILKHKLVIGACVAIALAVGVAATLLMTPIYTAGATLQIDRETARVVAGQDVQPEEQMAAGEEFFQTQYGLLRSRSLALRVMQSLGLDRSDAFLKVMGVKPGGTSRDARINKVVTVLQKYENVVPTRGSRLVSVSFDSPNPDLSAQIANSFAENFIAANLDRRFESSSYARDFLQSRLAEVKGKLEQSERELTAYASAQQIINVSDQDKDPSGTRSLAVSDLTALDAALSNAKAARISAEQKWREAQVDRPYGTMDILSSVAIQQLSQSKAQLMATYQEKLRTYKPDFPEMRQLKAQIDELDAQIKAAEQNIRTEVAQNARSSAEAQYNVAKNEEAALMQKVAELKSSVLDLRNRSIQYNILQREVDTNRSLYDGLLQRYKEVGVAGGITTNNISIVDRAEAPKVPSKPRPARNLALALMFGIALGAAAAVLIEALDQAIRSPHDVEQKIGLPLFGTIPKLDKGVTPTEALADIRSPFSEAYFSLRTALQFATRDGMPSMLLLTSSKPGEGKSTSAMAIAQSFARVGVRTLLIDADLRNPSQHRAFGVDNRMGLSNLLTGGATFLQTVQPTELPHLSLISSGPLPPSPTELLASARMRLAVEKATREFELVVIDGPPVMGLADAPMIASITPATLVVVEAGATSASQVKATVRRLQMARARVVGAVMTKFNVRKANYGYGPAYEYQYAYGSKPALRQVES